MPDDPNHDSPDRAPYADYQLLRISSAGGVARAVVDAPPVNVMTLPLFGELMRFGQQVGSDDAVRVVVLSSQDPDFFIAHFDVEAILGFPTEPEPERSPDNVSTLR